jgi:hypothetical protein
VSGGAEVERISITIFHGEKSPYIVTSKIPNAHNFTNRLINIILCYPEAEKTYDWRSRNIFNDYVGIFSNPNCLVMAHQRQCNTLRMGHTVRFPDKVEINDDGGSSSLKFDTKEHNAL